MAQIKSAKKSVRKDEIARMKNRSWKSRIKTTRKKLEDAIEGNKTDTLSDLFREYESVIDKAVSKGVLHKKTASRKKTGMAQRMKRTGEAGKPAKKTVKGKQTTAKTATSDAASEDKEDVKTAEQDS